MCVGMIFLGIVGFRGLGGILSWVRWNTVLVMFHVMKILGLEVGMRFHVVRVESLGLSV